MVTFWALMIYLVEKRKMNIAETTKAKSWSLLASNWMAESFEVMDYGDV